MCNNFDPMCNCDECLERRLEDIITDRGYEEH